MKQLLAKYWQYLLVALMFFTRIPVHLPNYQESDLNKAAVFFPLVGVLVGAIGALTFLAAQLILPINMALLLSMAATLLITGAFHEDGLADAVDGLGGGLEHEQVLTIMTDSRIGSYGAIALVMVLLLKFQALSQLNTAQMSFVLIAGHALSRFCAVLVMYMQPYVKAQGKAKPLATQISLSALMMAACFGLLPLGFLPLIKLVALLPVVLIWFWFSAKIKSRIGGYTGDCLGAMQQLTEVTFYVGLLLNVDGVLL